MFNIDALTQVTTMNPRNNFDLRISLKTEKITLSATAITKMGLANRGLTMYVNPSDGQVILSTQAEENSVFFKGKENAESKTPTFTAAALFNELKKTGATTFSIEEVARREDIVYYSVTPNVTETVESFEVEPDTDEPELEEVEGLYSISE
jgi:hypothetical protein